ncbi:MAG: hypothetical protein WD138_03770, partial [Halofilum sp. (in: g-proteobacteria)]
WRRRRAALGACALLAGCVAPLSLDAPAVSELPAPVPDWITVRATEEWVRRELEGKPDATPRAERKDPDTRRLEQELSEKLGAAVTLRAGKKGRGKLQIDYNSLDELEGILAHIR